MEIKGRNGLWVSIKYIVIGVLAALAFVVLLAATCTLIALLVKKTNECASKVEVLPITESLVCTDLAVDFLKYNKKLKDEFCGVERCHHRGDCEVVDSSIIDDSGNKSHIDYTYKCDCYGGAWGDKCDSTNVCDNNPCNGFPCRQVLEANTSTLSATCDCPRGYSGDHCEWTPCTWNTCENGGTCLISRNIAGFTSKCQCPLGYSGKHCSNFRCNGFRCQHGTCAVEASGNPICKCAPGYKGTDCRTKSCDCVHGVCHRDHKDVPSCSCDPGYFGDRCDFHVESSPWIACVFTDPRHISCRNKPNSGCTESIQCLHGTCSHAPSQPPTCECAPGYEGEDCSIKSCDCERGVCFRDDKMVPNCRCDNGFVGKRCDLQLVILPTVDCNVTDTKIVCGYKSSGSLLFVMYISLAPTLVYLGFYSTL